MKKTTTRNMTLILTGLLMSSFAFADVQPFINVKCTESKNHGAHKGNYTIANVSRVPMGVLTVPSLAHPDKDKVVDSKHYYTLTATSPHCATENNLVHSEFVREPREVTQVVPAVKRMVPATMKHIPAVTEQVLEDVCPGQTQQQGQAQQQQGKGKCEQHWVTKVTTPARDVIDVPAHEEVVTPATTVVVRVFDTVQKFRLVRQADACHAQQQADPEQQQQQAGACHAQQDQGQQTQQPPFVPACTGDVVDLTLFKADESPWNCHDRELNTRLTRVGQSHVFHTSYNPGWSPFPVHITCTATYEGMSELAAH